MAAPSGNNFPRCNLMPANNQELVVLWFKHRYFFYLQRLLQGRLIGPLCSCTLGIQQNVCNQLPQPQQAQMTQIASMFGSAEGDWVSDGPEAGFNSPQTGGRGRLIVPVLLIESPHTGDRVINPFAWSDTRGMHVLSQFYKRHKAFGGLALCHSSMQFYSGHTPDGGEMWPAIFFGFYRLSRCSLINIQGVTLCEGIWVLALRYSADRNRT